MDVISKRFPLVIKRILKNLDNQSLNRSMEASREFSKILGNQRFYWFRLIKKYSKYFQGFEESWINAINKIPANILKQLAIAVEKFFKAYPFEQIRVTPLHIGAVEGNLQLSQYLIAKLKDKNPEGKVIINVVHEWNKSSFKIEEKAQFLGRKYEASALHLAATFGNADLCRLIMDNDKNGNPRDINGR